MMSSISDLMGFFGDIASIVTNVITDNKYQDYPYVPVEDMPSYLSYEELLTHYEEHVKPGSLVRVQNWTTINLTYEPGGRPPIVYNPLAQEDSYYIPVRGPSVFHGMTSNGPDHVNAHKGMLPGWTDAWAEAHMQEVIMMYLGLEEQDSSEEMIERFGPVRPKWLIGEKVRFGWIHPEEFLTDDK